MIETLHIERKQKSAPMIWTVSFSAHVCHTEETVHRLEQEVAYRLLDVD